MNDSSIVIDKNKKYVLYISTTQANEMVDRSLEKENHSLVYSLGITSKNVYFDIDKGIKINEYIEGLSLDKTDSYDVDKVAKLLHTLHDSKKLSSSDYLPFERFIKYEKEASEFIDAFDKTYLAIREEVFKNKDYLERQEKVLCHNDAQKSNIIKSIDNDYYLIDFEFMGNNDPIYDIATFGNSSVEEGYNLLRHYFVNLNDNVVKRYYLWRMYISLQWYVVALVKHYRGEGKLHQFNFLDVASHFLNNAFEAYQKLQEFLSH